MPDNSDKVTKYTRQRVDKDGYINEEVWYQKFEWGKLKEEQGAHEIELENGKKFYTSSRLEKEYLGQEVKQERLAKEFKRRYPELNKE